MIDLTSAMRDPDLGFTGFTVQQTRYHRQNGVSIQVVQTLPASGCIHPGTPEMVQFLPEEERAEKFIAIYIDFALSLGENNGGRRVFRVGPDSLVCRILAGGTGTLLDDVRICAGAGGAHRRLMIAGFKL